MMLTLAYIRRGVRQGIAGEALGILRRYGWRTPEEQERVLLDVLSTGRHVVVPERVWIEETRS